MMMRSALPLVLIMVALAMALVVKASPSAPFIKTNITNPINETAKPTLNLTLNVNVISLSYEKWVNYPINGVLSTPLNYFTLLINASIINSATSVNSTMLINGTASLTVNISNVYFYSTIFQFSLRTNYSTLITVPVYSIPYGNYSINVTLRVFNFTKSKVYRLIMYKPKIIGVYITQCGLITWINNYSLINVPYVSSPKLNIVLYSTEPVELTLVNDVAGVIYFYNVTINGKSVVEESLPLINGTIISQLSLNGNTYSSYHISINSLKPWFTVNVIYGSFKTHVNNGSMIPVIAGHTINVSGSYLSNLSMVILVNGQQVSGSFFIINSGLYNVVASFNYGTCSVGSIVFSVVAYEPMATVTLLNSTIPIGIESKVMINITVPPPIVNERVYVTPLSQQFPVSIVNEYMSLSGNGSLSLLMVALQPGPMPLNVTLIMMDVGGFIYHVSSVLLLNVLKPEIDVNPRILNVTYGEDINITINLRAGRYALMGQLVQYQVTLNGAVIIYGSTRTNTNGDAVIQFKPNSTGIYMIYVTYSPSQAYSISNQSKVIVRPAEVVVGYLVNSTIIYGQSLSIIVDLRPRISGSVYIYLNGSLVGYVNVVNGTGVTLIKPGNAGYYNLTLYYPGSQNYLPSVAKSSIIVLKAPCSINAKVYGSLIVGDQVTIVGNITAPVTQLPIYINNSLMVVNVNNGEFYTTYTPTHPGTYLISIKWPGNNNYLSCSFGGIIKVVKATPMVVVKVLNNGTVALGGVILLSVIVKANNALPSTANVSLIINASGRPSSINELINNGSVLRISTNRVGEWVIYLNYGGNEWLNPVEVGPIEVTVIPGLLGIPWYVFVIYMLAVIMGTLLAMLIRNS